MPITLFFTKKMIKVLPKHSYLYRYACLIWVLCYASNIIAQESISANTKSSFSEWNFGVAFIPEENTFDVIEIWPGTSFLWGKTIINENNFILEYSAGFAFPSILTGKVGIGKNFNDTKVTFGVRPFPSTLYLQSSFTNGEKGYWIVSLEANPFDSDFDLSFGSKALLTFGYRWHKKK